MESITSDPLTQQVGTALFALAVLHTFFVQRFLKLAHRFPQGSVGENTFHFLGEIEVVFGLWAGALIAFLTFRLGLEPAIAYVESLNFAEPAFVFVIMAMAGTRPVIQLAEKLIIAFSKALPLPRKAAFYVSTLTLGPVLGSFITEPAAMTVTALILLDVFYKRGMSARFKYATLGLLFVNVSIGGTLTHFAAPPVLMVAGKWGWGIGEMTRMFGYKAALAVIAGTALTALVFRKELSGSLHVNPAAGARMKPPFWVIAIHVLSLALVVRTAHHPIFFLGAFLFFLGFATATREYQDTLKLRESLLVGFFLAGLVVLGSLQAWWLQPLLSKLSPHALFFGATALTAITDNAALTYLGSLVQGLSEESKYFLVAGAVAGGGLTVIANAPNPAGYGILKGAFGKDGISPGRLLLGAFAPTALAVAAFELLP